MTNRHDHDDKSTDNGLLTSPRPDDPAVVAAAAGKTTRERNSETPRQRQPSRQHNRGPPLDDDDGPGPVEPPAGDILVEAGPIEAYLKTRGVPKPNAYYLKRSGWPIGSTAAGGGGKLIASKRRLDRHIEKLTRGTAA